MNGKERKGVKVFKGFKGVKVFKVIKVYKVGLVLFLGGDVFDGHVAGLGKSDRRGWYSLHEVQLAKLCSIETVMFELVSIVGIGNAGKVNFEELFIAGAVGRRMEDAVDVVEEVDRGKGSLGSRKVIKGIKGFKVIKVIKVGGGAFFLWIFHDVGVCL